MKKEAVLGGRSWRLVDERYQSIAWEVNSWKVKVDQNVKEMELRKGKGE